MPKRDESSAGVKVRVLKTGVYVIRCLVNDKVNVGSTQRTFERRWKEHRDMLEKGTHHSPHLQRAWDKHGEENFVFEVTERCLPERCIEHEQYWLDHYQAYDREYGYNVCPTAGGVLGRIHTEEARRKISEAGRRPCAPETKAKIGSASKANWDDPEYRRKTIEALNSEETSIKRAEVMAIIQSDPEYRQKMSNMMKQRLADPEYQAIIATLISEGQANPEVRARMSESRRQEWKDQEIRGKRIAGLVAAWADEEVRARWVESLRKALSDPDMQARKGESLKKTLRDNPEILVRQSERQRKFYEDHPEEREKLSEKSKARMTPEARAHLSAKIKEYHRKRKEAGEPVRRSPEVKAKLVAVWADPDRKAARVAKNISTRARNRARAKQDDPSED